MGTSGFVLFLFFFYDQNGDEYVNHIKTRDETMTKKKPKTKKIKQTVNSKNHD